MANDRINDKGITKVPGTAGANFLAQYAEKDTSLDSMASLVMLPRLKIIQGQTAPELKKQFGEGSVIIRPGDALVWQDGDNPFLFVPLFFHREWIKWADNKDKDRLIVDGPVYKEDHPLAIKSKGKDSRTELYEGHAGKPDREKMYYSYVEHLCWTGVIYGDHPLAGQEVVLGMERGEFYNGREFINAISMRRQNVDAQDPNDSSKTIPQRIKVPLWAQVWALQPAVREGELGSWYGLNFQPADNPVIDPNDADGFSARHAELARLFQEGKIKVQQDDAGNNQGKTTDSPGEEE